MGHSQNLVPNGSFEERTECTYNDSSIEFAPPWFSPQPDEIALTNASPDTFHECMIFNSDPCPYPDETFLDPWLFGVPANGLGCESPFDGEGYAGIFCFYQNAEPVGGYREYLSVPLSEELLAGETYDVSFAVSLAERATHAIWNLQVLFTEGQAEQGPEAEPMSGELPQLNGTPNEYIDTRDGWQEISWEFTAEGGESYMTIGNFELNSQADTVRVMLGDPENHYFPGVYYYIDDVSVVRQTLATQDAPEYNFKTYPSPFTDQFRIQSIKMIKELRVYSPDGQVVLELAPFSKDILIEATGLSTGFYLVQVVFDDQRKVTKRIVKR